MPYMMHFPKTYIRIPYILIFTGLMQWFEVLNGLLGPHLKVVGLAFNCTFLLFGSLIQLIACARSAYFSPSSKLYIDVIYCVTHHI
ncbi:hypothetical protein HanHA300_Chr04g0151521 [Helianthus annuus]|nr:hypothetical protein HanHA300_Chr04g0151521 [Helianthus annuus]KAJ0590581.1 hypothetical protein HanIR_Chr04g0199071 [Helianthus annuus]KAJ0598356.1 hypothetical protein HanHA89_Chr04g0164901 [Helianthus annuus]KAJ0762613.1 hypothetical protein HanOQP8_Chr04g0163291 [Helianthus annuus]KAJ0932860.1 hypothetical protein HanPSC8_Chr04g0178511 [Helianthus annuus]